MSIQVSVLICTHRPDPIRFQRVLQALRQQTLAPHLWELVIVDNASQPPVAIEPGPGRLVREEQLGLSWARARALREFRSELAVFVDDDNVLAPDYLERCLELAGRYPWLGSLGSSTVGEFESAPPPDLLAYLPMLAVRSIPRASWSNRVEFPLDGPVPFGAGLCIRRQVAEHYLELLARHPQRLELGRTGASGLSACEDTDLVLSGCDLGYGYGVFPDLQLTHLIPSNRLKPAYLLGVAEGGSFARVLMKSWRGQPTFYQSRLPLLNRWIDQAEGLLSAQLPFAWRLKLAIRRGERKALEHLRAARSPH